MLSLSIPLSLIKKRTKDSSKKFDFSDKAAFKVFFVKVTSSRIFCEVPILYL